MAGRDVRRHGARDDVARLELAAPLARHEAPAGLVDQHRALAAHRLADQRHRIEPDIERGGMELHELHVGQRRAGPCRQRQPLADGAQRIGGVGVEPAQSAGRQHDPAARQQAGIGRTRRQHAGNAAVVDQQAAGFQPLDHRDRGRGLHRGDQGAHDRGPRTVARDMDDAAAGVRRLQAERQAAGRIADEHHAVALQLDDGGGRRRGDAAGDGGIAEAIAGRQRVGGVQGRPVVLAHRGGDAALGPGRRRALGQRYLGQQDDGPRRQPERGHQPGKTAADDDGAAGELGTQGLHARLP